MSDECVANIRTVRAFSMEEAAAELYEKETDESRRLHEMLGLGVGVFQGKVVVSLAINRGDHRGT